MSARRIMCNLEPVQGVGIGPAFPTDDAERICVWVTGTFTATITVEGSPDGVNWRSLFGVSASFLQTVNDVIRYVRVNTTSYTSGTLEVCLVKQLSV